MTAHSDTHIQQYLRADGDFAGLLSNYAIKAKRHRAHPNLVLFKYDQINSPFAEPIVRECRGIILDESDDWRIVCRAFDKFFNYGEGHAAVIDWSTARVQEKVDGSLCTMYPYRGEWHVATTGTPDGSGDVNGLGFTFAELFWKTYGNVRPVPGQTCFFFELTSPYNRIVVRHAVPSLTLLGARDMVTQRESRPSEWNVGHPPVREYQLGSFDDIVRSFEAINPLSQEGYVVVDGQFGRVKVKHPGYVALHHAKDGISRKAFVQIARTGETSEVIAAFPEFKPMLDEAHERVDRLVATLEADYERLRGIPSQKDFAIQAVKTTCSAALFAVRAKKAESIRAYVRDVRVENLMALLGYDADEPAITEAAQ